MRFVPYATVAMLALAVGTYVLAPPGSAVFDALVLDRTEPTQLWRSLTGQWQHSDASHLLWNISALAVLAGLIETADRGVARLLVDIAIGFTAVLVWFWLPVHDFERYVGLSGMLNTLLLTTVYLYRAELGRWVALGVAFGALAKSVLELTTGESLVGATHWTPAVGAHIAGWLGGLAAVAYRSQGDREPTR